MRDGSTYVNIDTSTNPKGEIRGQIKIPGSASNQIADTNLIAETCNNGTPCDGWGQGTKETIQTEGGKKVGEHSSNPDPTNDDPQNTPREGLGNFAENNTGNKNPSDLGDAVDGSLP